MNRLEDTPNNHITAGTKHRTVIVNRTSDMRNYKNEDMTVLHVRIKTYTHGFWVNNARSAMGLSWQYRRRSCFLRGFDELRDYEHILVPLFVKLSQVKRV